MKVVNFKTALVKSGIKVANESTTPQLILSSTYNGFKLNDAGAALIGVNKGDNVVMFDNYDVDDPCTQEERYLICASDGWLTGTVTKKGVEIEHGALLGTTRAFNYSHIYGTMLNDDADVAIASAEFLEKAGLIVVTPSGSKVSTKTITWELVPYQDEPIEIADGIERMVYRLVDPFSKAHNPKGLNSEADVEVDVEDIEE
jgi:hypothetical protein